MDRDARNARDRKWLMVGLLLLMLLLRFALLG